MEAASGDILPICGMGHQIAVAVGFAVLTAHISLFHLYVRDTRGQLSRHLATTA